MLKKSAIGLLVLVFQFETRTIVSFVRKDKTFRNYFVRGVEFESPYSRQFRCHKANKPYAIDVENLDIDKRKLR